MSVRQRLAEVRVSIFHETIKERDEVMRVALRDQQFGKGRRENSAISVIASAVEKIGEKSHNGLECSSVLGRQSAQS